MNTRTKLKTALVGISVVSALALSSGGAAYASGTRTESASNGCNSSVNYAGNTAYASAWGVSTTCLYSFQYRDEPSGATGVVYSGTVNAGQEKTDPITFINGQQIRACTHGNGLTLCTGWAS